MTRKKQLRQHLLAQRQAMSTVTWQQKSDAICRYLQDSAQIGAARTILAYASVRQEADVMPLLRSLPFQSLPFQSLPSQSQEEPLPSQPQEGPISSQSQQGRSLSTTPSVSTPSVSTPSVSTPSVSTPSVSFVPIVGLPRCQGKTLLWHQWHPLASPALQPGAYGIPEPAEHLPMIDPATLGPQDVILVPAVGCDRHGYRLGYGGGFYDRLLSTAPWNRMTTIGITFDFALMDCLPIEPWDQPLTHICTESGLMISDKIDHEY